MKVLFYFLHVKKSKEGDSCRFTDPVIYILFNSSETFHLSSIWPILKVLRSVLCHQLKDPKEKRIIYEYKDTPLFRSLELYTY